MSVLKKRSELTRAIKGCINGIDKVPMIIEFKESLLTPKFKITIEEVEDNFFIDSKGQRWIKQEKSKDTK